MIKKQFPKKEETQRRQNFKFLALIDAVVKEGGYFSALFVFLLDKLTIACHRAEGRHCTLLPHQHDNSKPTYLLPLHLRMSRPIYLLLLHLRMTNGFNDKQRTRGALSIYINYYQAIEPVLKVLINSTPRRMKPFFYQFFFF